MKVKTSRSMKVVGDPVSIERWLKAHANSGPATALEEGQPWVAVSVARRKILGITVSRRREAIEFPFPGALSAPLLARQYRDMAERLAAEYKSRATAIQLLAGVIFGAVVGAAVSAMTSHDRADVLLPTIMLLVFLGLTLLAKPFLVTLPLALTWERRALAYDRRATRLEESDSRHRQEAPTSKEHRFGEIGSTLAVLLQRGRWWQELTDPAKAWAVSTASCGTRRRPTWEDQDV